MSVEHNTNPTYLRYCAEHGETDPNVMLARDSERYPGGRMAGFQLWVSAKRRAFHALNPGAFYQGSAAGGIIDVDAWNRFLGVPALKASSCAYPDCVDQGPDGKCTRWLLGKCDPTLEAKP